MTHTPEEQGTLDYVHSRVDDFILDISKLELVPGVNVEATATAMQGILAELIAWQIDAGSERDAVNEDEDLTEALIALCNGWADEGESPDAPDDQAHHNH